MIKGKLKNLLIVFPLNIPLYFHHRSGKDLMQPITNKVHNSIKLNKRNKKMKMMKNTNLMMFFLIMQDLLKNNNKNKKRKVKKK